MAPPKKDAFADLFLSAASGRSPGGTGSNRSLSMLERQKQQQNNPTISSWSNLDILLSTPSGSVSSVPSTSGPSTPHGGLSHPDPFAIFDKPSLSPGKSPGPRAPPLRPPHSASGAPVEGSLLDDDEFVDAFTPEPAREPARKEPPAGPFKPEPKAASNTPLPTRNGDPRDAVLAELIDIGFPVDESNAAIDANGPNLQVCVNYIMDGGTSKPSRPKCESLSSPPVGASINGLSSEFFNKASFLFNRSKQVVMENIEQLQGSLQRASPGENLPAWLKNQHKYKSEAVERKAGGGTYEDYGSDEENINKEEIARFMAAQKVKERERQRQKYSSFKEKAKNTTSGGQSEQARDRPHQGAARAPQPGALRLAASSPQPPPSPQKRTQTPSMPSGTAAPEDVDLLGTGAPQLSRNNQIYASAARRRPKAAPSKARATTSQPLDQFLQSDYDAAKEKGSQLYAQGDYDGSLGEYKKCLAALPEKHELRVVIFSNLAITSVKVGDFKNAKQFCEDGLGLIGNDFGDDWHISEKPVKQWYVKLLSRKAESLEMAELFEEALACYVELVTKHGVNDRKTMDGKRRVNNIVNPPKPVAKPKAATPPSASGKKAVQRIQKRDAQEKRDEELKFKLHDEVQAKLLLWSHGKEDNLRSLLMSLSDILPESLALKKLTINDLMLPKKVKLSYMKVISQIHPDKLSKLDVQSQMTCQGVFVILSKSWDIFKEQNGIN